MSNVRDTVESLKIFKEALVAILSPKQLEALQILMPDWNDNGLGFLDFTADTLTYWASVVREGELRAELLEKEKQVLTNAVRLVETKHRRALRDDTCADCDGTGLPSSVAVLDPGTVMAYDGHPPCPSCDGTGIDAIKDVNSAFNRLRSDGTLAPRVK